MSYETFVRNIEFATVFGVLNVCGPTLWNRIVFDTATAAHVEDLFSKPPAESNNVLCGLGGDYTVTTVSVSQMKELKRAVLGRISK